MASTMRPTENATDQIIRLDVSWQAYETLSASLGDARDARLTYDGATLEIMAPGFRHESITARFTELLRDVKAEWSFDERYYIGSAPKIRDWSNIDLALDPPPDLVIEVDISAKWRNKEIYARFGVPEFWRYAQAEGLQAFALVDGAYVAITTSRVIPELPLAEIAVRITDDTESMEALHAWRAWLRANKPK